MSVRKSVCMRSVTKYLDMISMFNEVHHWLGPAYMSSAGEMKMSTGEIICFMVSFIHRGTAIEQHSLSCLRRFSNLISRKMDFAVAGVANGFRIFLTATYC